MITQYINAAMNRAHYEILKDDCSYYGEIAGFDGVFANAESLESCREQLLEVLEEWLLLRINKNLEIPTIENLTLKIQDVA